MARLLLFLCVLFAPVATSKLTTFLKDKNLTSVEERLSHLEQKIESRLNATERVLGQLLTGRADVRLEDLDILTLRSGLLSERFNPVLFSAYKSSSESGISTKVTIRFDRTYINIGNHYHTEDGIFIAPVSGTYMFHWTIITGGSEYSTQLMVGGTVRASSLVPYPGGRDSSSAMVILSVQKEDHVWIQIYGSNENVYGGPSFNGQLQSTFSGILLQKT
ncbi:complement C1q tumor necrosis factor-related protein 7-like [Crassostrea virginica]